MLMHRVSATVGGGLSPDAVPNESSLTSFNKRWRMRRIMNNLS